MHPPLHAAAELPPAEVVVSDHEVCITVDLGPTGPALGLRVEPDGLLVRSAEDRWFVPVPTPVEARIDQASLVNGVLDVRLARR